MNLPVQPRQLARTLGPQPGVRPIDKTDDILRRLGDTGMVVPPPSAALTSAVNSMAPAVPRRPGLHYLQVGAASLAYAAMWVVIWGLRNDLRGLPVSWLLWFGACWLLGFGTLTWLSIVPKRGDVMPRWRAAAVGAVAASVALPLIGLLFAEQAANSALIEPTVGGVVRSLGWCTTWGLMTAALPVVLAARVLRGAAVLQTRWIAAALGASGGALGGLMLHMHCHIADRLHVGTVHGGVVVLAAALSALLTPRLLRS